MTKDAPIPSLRNVLVQQRNQFRQDGDRYLFCNACLNAFEAKGIEGLKEFLQRMQDNKLTNNELKSLGLHSKMTMSRRTALGVITAFSAMSVTGFASSVLDKNEKNTHAVFGFAGAIGAGIALLIHCLDCDVYSDPKAFSKRLSDYINSPEFESHMSLLKEHLRDHPGPRTSR